MQKSHFVIEFHSHTIFHPGCHFIDKNTCKFPCVLSAIFNNYKLSINHS